MEECRKRAVALGFFDGVHLGHQALLRRTAEQAGMLGLSPALLTFDRSPREFVTGTPVPLLTTVQERSRTARALFPGMEVITVPFDRAMMTMPWEDFVVMLSEVYRARWLVAGHDFRFGHKNSGTAALLREKAAELGLGCEIIPAVRLEGVTVSSTHIRALLERGDTPLAGSLALFEEGTRLAAACTAMLDEAEQTVVKLQKGPDGEPVELPFQEEA